MNLIAVEVHGAGGLIGRYGFYTVPRVGEEIRVPPLPKLLTVQRVIHFGDPAKDNIPPPLIQLLVS